MDGLTLDVVYLARLLARRPSRMGWLAPWRRIWPHPGTVNQLTPDEWPWWGRRAWIMSHNLGLHRTAASLGSRLDRRADGSSGIS